MAGSLAIGGVVLAGCASSSGVSGAGPGSGECRSELASHEASLGEVVDSAALQREVARVVVEPRGLLLAQVNYDSVGAIDTVMIRSEWLPAAADEKLNAFIRASAPDSRDPDARYHLFLADTSSAEVRRLRDVASCQPRLLYPNHLRERIGEEARELGLRGSRRVRLLIRVETDGSVGEVQIEEGSGRADADLAAARVLRRATFVPARIEEIPVPVWVGIPVTLRRRR